MGTKLRHSLTGRLLMVVGFATILPLTLLMVVVLIGVYQATAVQNQQILEQVSRRYAAEFEVKMAEKLGTLKAMASVPNLDDQTLIQNLRALDPDVTDAWVRRTGGGPAGDDVRRNQLFTEVTKSQMEVLSSPDFTNKSASLGYPLFDHGRFRGMVAISFSLASFQTMVDGIRLLDHGYAFLTAHDGTRITHPDRTLVGVKVGNDVSPQQAQDILRKIDWGIAFSFEKRAIINQLWSRQYYSPVNVGRAWDPWFLVTVVPVDEVNRATDFLFALVLGGLLLTLIFVAGTTWRAALSVVRPLKQLAIRAEAVADGQLETRMPATSHDEVGQLAESFNRMADRLVSNLRDQEELVRNRTESLRQTIAELEQANAQIVDTAKLAVLGQLAATIAHEINTPLGAIRSSATFLSQTMERFSDYPEFLQSIDATDLEWYRSLVVRQRPNWALPTSEEERKRRRVLTIWLREHQVPEAQGLADDIVFLVGPEEDSVLAEAAERGKATIIRFAAITVAQLRSSAIILEASDRAASTVAALVDYSRKSEVLADETINIPQEMNTLLTLYYGVSKRNVEVVREFEPGTTVRGDRDKLNQVWVNLINNALQAMDYRGRLVIRVRTTPTGVEVSVANNGPPIPKDLQEKIFQPFFTTKNPGEGVGLGLDICRRIVQAHQGSISLTEDGAYTVFTVFLPSVDARTSQ